MDELIIASSLPAGVEEDRVSAMLAAILSLGEQIASELGRGMLDQVYVKGESGYIVLTSIGDEAVRTSDTTYVGLDGKSYEKNLAGTCLGECHSDKDEFCDSCHEYVGAEPYCWDCHGSPGDAL